MCAITINSNIASFNAQRRLSQSSKALEQSFQRLSSGLRINRAGDDAAGLAIASSLSTDSRVFNQGIRNLNDGISLLNVAEGALTEMGNVVSRISELAEQSSNGTLSLSQRRALNQEANALINEYNRIIDSTKFNNIKLLDGSFDSLKVQGGYGANGQISLALGSEIAREIPDGTFGTEYSFDLTSYDSVEFNDANGDGKLDLITTDNSGATVGVHLANGDGTFRARISSVVGGSPGTVRVADFTGDGIKDIAVYDTVAQTFSVFRGDGNNGFTAQSSFSSIALGSVETNDFNNDNLADLVVFGTDENHQLFLGNGNGTFRAAISFSTPGINGVEGPNVVDMDGDGNLDLISRNSTTEVVKIFYGTGSGTFESGMTVGTMESYSPADINNDGVIDIAGHDGSGNLVVRLAQGARSYGNEVAISSGINHYNPGFGDFNYDGYVDIVAADFDNPGPVYIRLGNGDGTFGAATSVATSAPGLAIGFGFDIDGNGGSDSLTFSFNDGQVYLRQSNLTTTNALPHININTKAGAKFILDITRDQLDNINRERGQIGAFQSRLTVAISNLGQTSENVRTAQSRIEDADTAEESALLLRNRILQQAGAAVLGQANQLPALALLLLE